VGKHQHAVLAAEEGTGLGQEPREPARTPHDEQDADEARTVDRRVPSHRPSNGGHDAGTTNLPSLVEIESARMQHPDHGSGVEVDQVLRWLDLLPAHAQPTCIRASDIRGLDDETPSGSQQSGDRSQRSRPIRQVLEDIEQHDDAVSLNVSTGMGRPMAMSVLLSIARTLGAYTLFHLFQTHETRGRASFSCPHN